MAFKPLVILDFDGVVRDSGNVAGPGTRAALNAAGLKAVYSPKDFRRMRGFKEFNNRRKALEALYSVAVSGKSLKVLLRTAPQSILGLEKRFPVPKAVLDEMEGANRKAIAKEILKSPPVKYALAALKKLGKIARLAVVSDSYRRGVTRWMRKEGLNGFFEAVLCREDVPEMKPSPEGILAVLEKLRAKPGPGIFYVGDAESDMVAAKRAGVAAIGVLGGMASRKMLIKAGARKVFGGLDAFAEWLRGVSQYKNA